MEGSIIFYTYGSTLELNGQQFEAGRLTEDLLNLSPDDYHPLHERMVRIRTLMDIYEYVRKSELWWKLNDEMEQLCQELRRYTVFRLLPDDCYDAFFSVIREITGQFSLFPPEEHSLSEDYQTKLLSASAEEFFQSDDGDSDPEISLGLLDLFRRREGSEEKGELFYYEMFRLLGACEDTWSAYKKYIDRYMMYLHDIRAFVPTIRNFIKFILSTLTTNGPESYAAALYGFYNDDRTAEKLIVNPITYHGDCYRRHDEYMLSYVPRELPDGSMAICQEHVTDSLQALMKADYPHLKGRMTRWLEQHIGILSLSKHEMDAVRQAQRLYHSGQFSIEEIAEKMDVLLEQAVKHIRYNTHFVGVNDLIPGSYDGDPFERLMPGNLSVSAEQVVYRKVCIELLQELFDALPKKDRDILGKFYGVFGFEKTSLKEIGMYHMMKESAVEKAKERAVTKLKKAYPGSRLQIWRNVHRMIRRPILPAKDDRALRRSFTTSTLRNQESGRS